MNNGVGVSVAIPIYNAELFLEDAIKSVILQSHSNWELLLVNDGSTDQSMSIAKKYVAIDSRIKLIDDGLNKKLPFRLNQIIQLSKFEYIARMDADDIMHPDRLIKQLSYILDHGVDLVSCSYYTIDRENNVRDKRLFEIEKLEKNDFLSGNYYICHPSIMAKREWFLRNNYNDKYDRAEDYELWLRAILKSDFNIQVMSDLLMFYREDGSINKNKLVNSYKTTLSIFKDKRLDFSIGEYFYVVIRNIFKIFVVNVFYSNFLKKLLIKKRAHINFLDTEEAKSMNECISRWLKSNS